jgi:hypothetical protein
MRPSPDDFGISKLEGCNCLPNPQEQHWQLNGILHPFLFTCHRVVYFWTSWRQVKRNRSSICFFSPCFLLLTFNWYMMYIVLCDFCLPISHDDSHSIIIELFLSCGLAWLVLPAVWPHVDFVPASATGQKVLGEKVCLLKKYSVVWIHSGASHITIKSNNFTSLVPFALLASTIHFSHAYKGAVPVQFYLVYIYWCV